MGPPGCPTRPRNAWFLHVNNVLGVYEVCVGYKNTKQKVTPLTASNQKASVKIPFGPPVKCEYRERKAGQDIVREFKFENQRRESIALGETIFNNLEFGVNSFSKFVTSMYVNNKKELLALYLTMINCSENFVHHREGTHSTLGLSLNDGSGVVEGSLAAAGGSVEDFQKFLTIVKENATMVDSANKGPIGIAKYFKPTNKRKVSEESANGTKLSKTETVAENEKKEIEDKDGLEQVYKQTYYGVAHVPIENISVSPEMELKVNKFRVKMIEENMRKRYDPSQSVLVVCPEVDGSNFDGDNVEKLKFFVIQKVHAFKALQSLDRSGEFVKMADHHNRNVLCYILATSRPDMMAYGNLRGNFISGKFARPTKPQELLHVFESLTLKDSTVKSIKVVERMSKLCCIGTDEGTAIKKLCQWSREAFAALMVTIERFESYQTKDVKRTGNQQALAEGKKLSMTNKLLKLLAKCPEKYFLENYEKVVTETISLNDLADNYRKITEVGKVYKVLMVISKYESVQALRDKYPGKFDMEKMEQYVGAVIDGEEMNFKAVLLQDYYRKVVKDPEHIHDCPVEFVDFDSVGEVFRDHEIMDKFEMVVYNMKRMRKNICMNIIMAILGGDKTFHAALLVFPTELDHFEIISYLRSQEANTDIITGYKLVPLLFRNQFVSTVSEVGPNVKYAILFGKMSVLKTPLLVYHGAIAQICQVIDRVCPPESNVALVSDIGVPSIKLHNNNLDKKVKYFGGQNDITRFIKKLDSDKTAVDSSDSPEDLSIGETSDSEEIASTSTTPVKSSTNLDDSGFAEKSPSLVKSLGRSNILAD